MGRGEGYGRPAILKPEDIQAMADNDEEEEGGWAGAQDEVDYAAKLDFEDFDDDEKPSMEASTRPEKRSTSGEPETRWQSNEGRTVSDVIYLFAAKQANSLSSHYKDNEAFNEINNFIYFFQVGTLTSPAI